MTKLHSFDIGTVQNHAYNEARFSKSTSLASDTLQLCLKMCFTTTCCYLWAIIFFLSHPSLPLANRHTSSGNRNPLSAEKPSASKGSPLIPAEEAAFCNGPRLAILPPSVTLPKSMWSVRAMMFLQILTDGTINATLEWNQYGEFTHFYNFLQQFLLI